MILSCTKAIILMTVCQQCSFYLLDSALFWDVRIVNIVLQGLFTLIRNNIMTEAAASAQCSVLELSSAWILLINEWVTADWTHYTDARTQFIPDQWFSNCGLCTSGGIWDFSGHPMSYQQFYPLFILIENFSSSAQLMDIWLYFSVLHKF